MTRHLLHTIAPAILLLLAFGQPVTAQLGSAPKPESRNIPENAGDVLATLPLQSAGRIKPFDSFARFTLLSCYHKSKIGDLSASQWLAQLLLDPDTAYEVKCFRIRNEDLVADLGLKKDPQGKHIYSFNEIRAAIDRQNARIGGKPSRIETILKRDADRRSLVEKQLVKFNSAVFNYFSISRTFTCLTPEIVVENEKLAKELDMTPGKAVSFFHIYQRWEKFAGIANQFQSNFDRGDPYQIAVFQLASRLQTIQRVETPVGSMTIISPDTDPVHNTWRTPWQVLDFKHKPSAHELKLITSLQTIVDQLINNNDTAAITGVENFLNASHASTVTLSKRELTYNRFDAFTKSIAFYLLGFILLCLGWLFAGKQLRWVSWGTVLVGCLIHGGGILLRMMIRGRPAPVTTIYESIVFVGFICVLIGLIIEFRRRDSLGLLIATVPGIILHFVGFKYALEGDTMGRLVAVLDSNFWLSTHVVSITIGYGVAAAAGLIANTYLFIRWAKPDNKELIASTAKNFTGVTLMALLFCIVGTILGGIWGDQSWGRFWGWDPKENGALLICLWLLIVLHGKWGKQLKELGVATMLSLTNITVLLAWFGVNLLSVGLHSYGFTEGAAFNLTIACAAIVILTFIPSLGILIRDAARKNQLEQDPAGSQ